MIGYLILVHRFPEQFKRMFRAIHVPGNHYLIHVDKRSGPALAADVARFLEDYPNARILKSQKALWGGYSLVEAELRGMAELLTMGDWDYFINLSGQDFPLKSQAYIAEFLACAPGTQYIRAVNQQVVRPDTMNRVERIFLEIFGRIVRTNLPRSYLAGVTPFIGTQWKAVTRDFVEFVCRDRTVDQFKRFFRRTLIADESFFQTVLMNAFPYRSMVNDDLRTIDWIPDGDIKLRPRTFVARDALRLMLSPDLFARKFDSSEDSEILDILEKHVTSRAVRHYVPAVEPALADPSTPEPDQDDFQLPEVA